LDLSPILTSKFDLSLLHFWFDQILADSSGFSSHFCNSIYSVGVGSNSDRAPYSGCYARSYIVARSTSESGLLVSMMVNFSTSCIQPLHKRHSSPPQTASPHTVFTLVQKRRPTSPKTPSSFSTNSTLRARDFDSTHSCADKLTFVQKRWLVQGEVTGVISHLPICI